MRGPAAAGLGAFALVLGFAGLAAATPRALPFTYPYATLPQGNIEVEQFVDVTPSVALSTSTGAPANLALLLFTTEVEYGLTDRLELGLYFQLAPGAGEGFSGAATLQPTAVKQRLRYRFGQEGQLPIDISVYGEVAESDREIEIEAKLNLQKRFGYLHLLTNLWAEYELYYDGRREWVLNPTLGATYEVTQALHVGAEGWMRAEFPETSPPSPRPYELGPHVFVGPTVMLNFGRLWWTVGGYFRVSDTGRPVAPGDAFGRVWVRSVVGVDL